MCARARDEKPCEHTHTLDGEKTLHHTHMLSVVRQTQAVMCAGATDRIDTATSERAHETIEMCTTSHARARPNDAPHIPCACVYICGRPSTATTAESGKAAQRRDMFDALHGSSVNGAAAAHMHVFSGGYYGNFYLDYRSGAELQPSGRTQVTHKIEYGEKQTARVCVFARV